MALRRCKHLGVNADERLRRDRVYRCNAPEPEQPVMTAAITMSYDFQWPPQRRYVTVDHHCEACPLFEAVSK